MLRKIGNYFAVMALTLVVAGVPVLANSSVSKREKAVKNIKVDEKKGFYQELIQIGGKHFYTVNVEAGEEVKIKVRSTEELGLKIQTPNGEAKGNSQEKFFEVHLRAPGEYVFEIESEYIARYSFQILSR